MTEPLPDPLVPEELERQIVEAMADYLASKNGPPEERVRLWARFLELHAKRSPKTVFEMEKVQGLS